MWKNFEQICTIVMKFHFPVNFLGYSQAVFAPEQRAQKNFYCKVDCGDSEYSGGGNQCG